MNSSDSKIKLEDVTSFVRTHGLSIVLRGVISLTVVIALLALYYAFAPRAESYRQDVAITLETRNGEAVYPNDRLFSSEDLISAPVLDRVWREQKLESVVKFEDFCKWFSIAGYDRERVKLDAEYQTKMSKRNITVTELSTLQSEYESKLAALTANNRYLVAMKPTCALAREKAVEVLSSVPKVWFAESVILNAPQMPAMTRADSLSNYLTRLKTGESRLLEMMDALRLYRSETQATCAYVRKQLLRGRNVRIEGQDLGVYESRLSMIESELLRLKNRMLREGDPSDLEEFVSARLDDMACETMAVEEKVKALRQTIDLLKDTSDREANASKRGTSATEGAVTLQADASFFKDFTDMVRRDASQEAVQKYAEQMSLLMSDMADIKARKLYYDQIGAYAAKTQKAGQKLSSASKLLPDIEAVMAELLAVGEKVTAFRDCALTLYRTSDQFYALPAAAQYGKSFRFALSRLALGLLALWALYNCVRLATDWSAAVKAKRV